MLYTIFGGLGFALAFVPMCADIYENPWLIIPVLIGFALLYYALFLKGGWVLSEEDDYECRDYVSCSDGDFTYIDLDSVGSARDLDFR